jgi:hypothetical protein
MPKNKKARVGFVALREAMPVPGNMLPPSPQIGGVGMTLPRELSEVEEGFADAWARNLDTDGERKFGAVCSASGVSRVEGLSLRRSLLVLGRVAELKDEMILASRVSWREAGERAKRVLYEAMGNEDVKVQVMSASKFLDVASRAGCLEGTKDVLGLPLSGGEGVEAAAARLVGLPGGKE